MTAKRVTKTYKVTFKGGITVTVETWGSDKAVRDKAVVAALQRGHDVGPRDIVKVEPQGGAR